MRGEMVSLPSSKSRARPARNFPRKSSPRTLKRAARSFQPPILAQSREQPLGQRDQAGTIPLAVAHLDQPGLAVDVTRFERKDLGDAEACAVGGHHDHAVLERLDFAKQGVDLVAADHGGQLLRDTRPGNVLHLRRPFEGDSIEEAQTSDIHLDAGSARAALMVREQELPDFLAAHRRRRAHEVPHESLRALQIALLGAS